MPETDNQLGIPAPPATAGNDTRTRKTVLLRGTATPAVPVSDPMLGRDTDTGNLEVLEDTKTRRTVKLKPLAPQPRTPTIKLADVDSSAKDVAPEKSSSATDNNATNTRKNIVLPIPSATEDYTATRKTPSLKLSPKTIVSPASAIKPAPVNVSTETSADPEVTATRKTLKLSPVIKSPETTANPVPTPIAVETKEDTTTRRTQVLSKPVASGDNKNPLRSPVTLNKPDEVTTPAADEEDDGDNSKTMKISRPFRLNKPQAPPSVQPPPVLPKPGVVAPPPVAAAEERAEQTSEKTESPELKAVVPPLPKVPSSKVPVPEPPVVKEEPPVAQNEDSGSVKDVTDENIESDEAAVVAPPSTLYTILAAITLLFVIGSTTFVTLHYLKFSHGIDIANKIPGLSNVK